MLGSPMICEVNVEVVESLPHLRVNVFEINNVCQGK